MRLRYSLLYVLLATAITTATPVYGQVASQPAAPRKWALLVGVNSYQNRNLVPLKFAERDVTELGKVLTGGGFEVRVLTGNQTNAKKYREELQKMLKQLNRNDLLLLAFSGHGVQMRVNGINQPFLCPYNSVPSESSTLTDLSEVIENVGLRGAGTNLILIDAFRDIDKGISGKLNGISGDGLGDLPRGTALFFSCSTLERSKETENAGGGHGLFFHSLLQGLRGAPFAKNEKGDVTWAGLTGYVKDRVGMNSVGLFNENQRQTPYKVENLTDASTAMALVSNHKEGSESINPLNGSGGIYGNLFYLDYRMHTNPPHRRR